MISKDEAYMKQEQLRNILIKSKALEFGDCILDEICILFDYPDTNYITEDEND